MEFYLPQHCYHKTISLPNEGNLLVLNPKFLSEEETVRNQLWICMEETEKHFVVAQLEDGIRERKKQSEFYGLLNLAHLQDEDKQLLDTVKNKITNEDYRFWNCGKFPYKRYPKYRIVTELSGNILAMQMNDSFHYEYSIWMKKDKGETVQMLQSWGGDYDGAKMSFAIECGLMKPSDLPKGG